MALEGLRAVSLANSPTGMKSEWVAEQKAPTRG
jgi:hypothetical protein